MSAFCAVNTPLVGQSPAPTEHTSTSAPAPLQIVTAQPEKTPEESVKPSNRDSFLGVAGQKPLPDLVPDNTENGDVAMDTAADDEGASPSQEGDDSPTKDGKNESGEDSVEDDSKNKKKKTQKFFCTDYPPCKLNFTRSEHLARHIRKHTGERPFQCHCGRRFSRLDNLRQHAQTVHVHEEIPAESPAASGSRYQRHVRAERVRPVGRSRASTLSSVITPAQQARHGHGRNLSTSSITSNSSVSTFAGDDFRRNLGLQTPRNRLSLDTYPAHQRMSSAYAGPQYFPVGASSPSGYSTPTSATFSIGTNSPRYSSGLHTPSSSISKSGYPPKEGDNRLSTQGTNPFQSDSYSQSYMSPVPSHAALSRAGAQYASPIRSFADPRRDAFAEAESRRRTWHANTSTGVGQRPASSSGISAPPKPLFSQQQTDLSSIPLSSGGLRLPGIETFDNLNRLPPPPVRRAPSPMELDPPSQPVEQQATVGGEEGRPQRISWTSSLRQDMNRLDIDAPATQEPASGPWKTTIAANLSTELLTTPRPVPARPTSFHSRTQSEVLPSIASHPDEMSESEDTHVPVTAKRSKRHGWYMQPPTEGPTAAKPAPSFPTIATTFRTTPESGSDGDGAPTPVTQALDAHPTIIQTNGHTETQDHAMEGVEESKRQPLTFRSGYPDTAAYSTSAQPTPFGLPKVYETGAPPQFGHSRATSTPMTGFEALVAAATAKHSR